VQNIENIACQKLNSAVYCPMIKTLNDIRSTHKLSDPKTVKTKLDLNYTKFPETACTIPAGTEVQVHFSEVNHGKIYFEYNGSLRVASVINAHKYFTGFRKCPSINSIQKMEWDRGGCMTCTGKFVEPDGTGSDGSPSWMLVIGII
jgi:hypothetical protein